MRTLFFLLCLLPTLLQARSGFVDQNVESLVIPESQKLYAFDSRFKHVLSQKDLELKIRLSTFANFSHGQQKLSGEMIMSQGKFSLNQTLVSRLRMEDIKGAFFINGGKIETSEFRGFQLDQMILRDLKVLHTNFREFTGRGADFKDVVFSETDFLGVSLPGLQAQNVKFLGRTAALNLRGCFLKDVEFNFDRIQYLSLIGCELQNVYVNGQLIRDPIILKEE